MSNLIINYQDRDLDFQIKGKEEVSGQGLKDLISHISSNDKIDKIEINGGSGSYTFSRQVYLLVNLLSSLNECPVYVNGTKQQEDKIVIPSYN